MYKNIMPNTINNRKTGKIPFAGSFISESLFDHVVNASIDYLLRNGAVNDRRDAYSFVLEVLYKMKSSEYLEKFKALYGHISGLKLCEVSPFTKSVYKQMNEYLTIYNRFLCKTDRYLKLI